jgi:hypothetical protein
MRHWPRYCGRPSDRIEAEQARIGGGRGVDRAEVEKIEIARSSNSSTDDDCRSTGCNTVFAMGRGARNPENCVGVELLIEFRHENVHIAVGSPGKT